jgi:hypothetical protein
LFIGAAVLVGVVAGVIVPVLAISGDSRDRAGRRAVVAGGDRNSSGAANRDSAPSSPDMPDVVGESLDVADQQLDERGIPYDTEGGGLFGVIDDSNWEVCDTYPDAGEPVRDSALLAVDRPGEC